jgi:hypothetical protein
MNIVSNRCNDVKRMESRRGSPGLRSTKQRLVIENGFFFGYTSLLILIFEIYLSLMEIVEKITYDYQVRPKATLRVPDL